MWLRGRILALGSDLSTEGEKGEQSKGEMFKASHSTK